MNTKTGTYGELYRDWLDELYDVGHFSFSQLLEAGDPIAFSIGLDDFVDDPSRFSCDDCGATLKDDESWGAGEDDYPTCTKCKDEAKVA